jgi:hypothetical protein
MVVGGRGHIYLRHKAYIFTYRNMHWLAKNAVLIEKSGAEKIPVLFLEPRGRDAARYLSFKCV